MNETKPLPIGRIFVGSLLLFISVHYCFSVGLKTAGGIIMALPILFLLFVPVKLAPSLLLCYIAVCFSISNRAIYIGEIYHTYPQEILFLVLLLYLAFTQRFVRGESLIPISGRIFAVLVVVGIITAMNYRRPLDEAIFYAKGLLLFLPIFFCIRRVVTSERVLDNVCISLVIAATVACYASIADYHGLAAAKLLFGETEKELLSRFHEEELLQFEHPFYRASGVHALSTFMASSIYLIFFVTLYLYHASKNQKLRIFLRFAQLGCLLYIFYSGYRSIWISLALSFGLYAIHRGAKGFVGIALAVLVVAAVLPQAATDRFGGLGISGQALDSSVVTRIERTEEAMRSLREKPLFGGGWGSAGLVHNDFLQIGADAGLPTLIAFSFFYGGALFQLYRKFWLVKKQGNRLKSHCLNVFFSALTGYAFIWASNPHFNRHETFITFWIMLALALKIINLPMGETTEAVTKHPPHPVVKSA